MYAWQYRKRTQIGAHSDAAPFSGGYTLVEVVIVAAITTIVFGAIFLSFQAIVSLLGSSKAKAGALALATDEMEYIRSLSYGAIGTDGGVPSGTIAQQATTTLNGIQYIRRVLIQYVDDESDGTGGADTNGILADYKQVKVEYSWKDKNATSTVALISNVVPVGIESTAGGGTIRVNVFDAEAQPVSGAEVQFVNDTTTTTIDTARYTNIDGVTYLAGAPAASSYGITVTASGYSTDQTRKATTSVPVPNTPPVTVSKGLISTMNFQIDELSDLLVRTVEPSVTDIFLDDFSSAALLATTSSTTVASGNLVLAGGGPYTSTGTAQSTSTRPSTITAWHRADFTATGSPATAVGVQVLYKNSGVFNPIPDEDLPGNSTGFTASPIDLTDLDEATYDELALSGQLSTTDPDETPEVSQWSITYLKDQPPLSGITLDMSGDKMIGTDGGGQPVPKYESQFTTDASGEMQLTDLEWDIYDFSLVTGGYTIAEACPAEPYSLEPGVNDTITFTLRNTTGPALLAHVVEADGTSIPDALVELSNVGVSDAAASSLCGQVFFDGLYSDADYVVTANADGYASTTITGVEVTGSTSTVDIVLN